MITNRSLQRLLLKYKQFTTYQDLPCRKRCKKLISQMQDFMNAAYEEDDEITARKMKKMLNEKWPMLVVSIDTIKHTRRALGWVCTQPHYCQLVRDLNKRKRVVWYKEALKSMDIFNNIIFSDKCTVQLDSLGRLCFRKHLQPRKPKPRPKHPAKIHIWEGISHRGATQIVMFTGIMNAARYQKILETALLPFIDDCHGQDHRFQQDNDPKHCSKLVGSFWKTNKLIGGEPHQNPQILIQ